MEIQFSAQTGLSVVPFLVVVAAVVALVTVVAVGVDVEVLVSSAANAGVPEVSAGVGY